MIGRRDVGAVRWLTLQRPDKLNAFTGAIQHDLRVALEQAGAVRDVRAIEPADHARAVEEFPLLLDRDGAAAQTFRVMPPSTRMIAPVV